MRAILIALAFVLAIAPAGAAPTGGPMSAVQQFVNGLNTGNTKSALAVCASPAQIIDDFPPHLWSGPTACADWLAAFNADTKKHGIDPGPVTLGTPWHVKVTGDRAYVVVPATYKYTLHGKPVVESGSVLTVALKETRSGWRIAAWAWAQH